MPPQISSVLCLCVADLSYAVAMLLNSMPPPGRSFHSHASADPRRALLSPPSPRAADLCLAVLRLCLRRASPNRAQP